MYHLAQLNIAKMLTPIDDPIAMDFVNTLERIKTLSFKSKYSVNDLLKHEPSL